MRDQAVSNIRANVTSWKKANRTRSGGHTTLAFRSRVPTLESIGHDGSLALPMLHVDERTKNPLEHLSGGVLLLSIERIDTFDL